MPDDRPKKGDTIIFADVESLPCEKDNPLWLKLKNNIKRRDSESDEDYEARVESVRRDTALTGPLGRAWMIGFAVGKGDPVICQYDGSPEGEKALLEEFLGHIEEYDNPWWVGHNLLGYDVPFLQVRALHHGLPKLARKMSRLRQKPWESRVLDTQKLWPRTGGDRQAYRDWGLRGLGKLDTICSLLGIEQQTGVMGPNVYEAYLSGDQEGVAEHLKHDINQVREVLKRLWPVL